MTQQKITIEKEQKYREILELAKESEQKLKKASEMATELAEKCQKWYEEAIKRKQQSIDEK